MSLFYSFGLRQLCSPLLWLLVVAACLRSSPAIEVSLDPEHPPAIQATALSPTQTDLPAVAGRQWLLSGSVLAEKHSDGGVTLHKTPSGSPCLPLHLSYTNRLPAVPGRNGCSFTPCLRSSSTINVSLDTERPPAVQTCRLGSHTNGLLAVAGRGGSVIR